MFLLKSSNRINLQLGKFTKAILGVLVAAAIVPSFACGIDAKAASAVRAICPRPPVGISIGVYFADENFAKYVYEDVLGHNNWDNEGANYHLTGDDFQAINNCKVIEVRNIGCSSITGIEHFTHLQYLNCSNNHIERVDVSNCHELEELICDRNNIHDLNVTGCTSLTTLECSGNPINKLDLRNCRKLLELGCSATEIDALDVSGCEWIGSVNASHCGNLAELNIAGCEHVKKVNVSNCNNLTELNLARCQEVEEVNAHNCGNLKEINVIDAARINRIIASNCEELEWIHFSPEVQRLLELNIDNSHLVRRNIPVRLLDSEIGLDDNDVER